jgi:hypothetical protein
MTYAMSAKYLFVNEDEVTFTSVRPKRTSTSVRRHVRLQRGRAPVQQKQHELQMRTLPPKALQIGNSKVSKSISSRSTQKSTEQPREEFYEHSASLSQTPEPRPEFEIPCHIRKLYPDAHKLITFYISCEGGDHGHLSLGSTTTWPTIIIRKALESERHTLFLLCYITSIISYLNHSASDEKLRKHGRNASLSSEASSCSSSAASFDDWPYPYSSNFQQDSYSPQQSNFSLLYTWQYPNLSTSAQSLCSSPISPALQSPGLSYRSSQVFQPGPPFQAQQCPIKPNHLRRPSQPLHTSPTTPTYYSQSSRPSFSDPALILASCSSLASDPIHLTHQAVSTLKSRLSTKHKSSPACEFLFPVWCLFRAAILQGDEFAAAAHERFLRHLVYKADGVKDLPQPLIRVIIEVDLKLSDAEKSEYGEERSGGEVLVESEMRERMVLNPRWKEGSQEKEWWWDMGWS